ncbi:hypothetical protein [Methanosphaera sp. BMS]|uniref:hypothetical protein n=1 Tax=Methanosphaera sp. BMS TaxID=1789762 RepID=UPI000DD337EA
MNLLTKFHEIDSGEILVDGKNINMMPQKNIMDSCTIIPRIINCIMQVSKTTLFI